MEDQIVLIQMDFSAINKIG